jgi:hypothetical protein
MRTNKAKYQRTSGGMGMRGYSVVVPSMLIIVVVAGALCASSEIAEPGRRVMVYVLCNKIAPSFHVEGSQSE